MLLVIIQEHSVQHSTIKISVESILEFTASFQLASHVMVEHAKKHKETHL